MQELIIYHKGIDEEITKLDKAIADARAEMEESISRNEELTIEETIVLSQKLDPLIAYRQMLIIYDNEQKYL